MKQLFWHLIWLIWLLSCRSPVAYQPTNTTPIPAYVRSEWKHWIDEDKNCLNTRHEILKQRSKSSVTFSKNGCSVKSGEWDDYYYPEQLKLAAKIDIDHLIPLKHAHDHGGHSWSEERKKEFANDLENLVITNRKYNRQKGSQGIDTWLPVHKDFACKYMKDWVRLKKKYQLNFSEQENLSLKTATEQGCSVSGFPN